MPDYVLILHPVDPTASVEIADLYTTLRALGLIGAPLPMPEVACQTLIYPDRSNWYSAGPELLERVTFLGCSPVIRLAATHDGDTGFCRICLSPPLPYPIWCAPLDVLPPRCPRCRAPDATWRMALPAWEADPVASRRVCPACGHSAPLHQWRLREVAGFGRSYVELWGIHHGEAVPGEALLTALTQLSGGPWRWFYWSEPQQNTR